MRSRDSPIFDSRLSVRRAVELGFFGISVRAMVVSITDIVTGGQLKMPKISCALF